MKGARARTDVEQLELPVEREAAERERERQDDTQRLLLEHLLAACRSVMRELGAELCANELDRIWSPLGRGVSVGVLKNCLSATNGERNYFRIEWAIWFATQSEEVAELLMEVAGRGKPKKTPEEELRDLKDLMRRELGATANKLIRKAEALP